MRELIRKILHENPTRKKIIESEGASDLTKDQKKLFYDKRFQKILNIEPNIIDFINLKFKQNVKIETEEIDVWLGSDNLPGKNLKFVFYIMNKNLDAHEVKDKIINYIQNYFGINPYEYGSGISLEFYKMSWKKI